MELSKTGITDSTHVKKLEFLFKHLLYEVLSPKYLQPLIVGDIAQLVSSSECKASSITTLSHQQSSCLTALKVDTR